MTTDERGRDRSPWRPGAEATDTARDRRCWRRRRAWDRFVAAAPNGSYPQLTRLGGGERGQGLERDAASSSTRRTARSAPRCCSTGCDRGRSSAGTRPAGRSPATIDRPTLAAFTGALQRAAAGAPPVPRGHRPGARARAGPERWLEELGWRPIPAIQIDRTRLVDLTRDGGGAVVRPALERPLVGQQGPPHRLTRSRMPVRPVSTRSASCISRRRAGSGFEANAAFRETFRGVRPARARARCCWRATPDGRAAATLMLLDCGDRVIERYGASSTAGAAARANYLVKWESIRASRERGMAPLRHVGHRRRRAWPTFKASFGGYERAVHRCLGAGHQPGRCTAASPGIARLRDAGGRSSPAVRLPAVDPGVACASTECRDRRRPDGWDARAVDAPGGHVMQGTAWAEHRRVPGCRSAVRDLQRRPRRAGRAASPAARAGQHRDVPPGPGARRRAPGPSSRAHRGAR